MACSGDGFTLLSKFVTICHRSWEYVLTEELLYNCLELVKGMVIDPWYWRGVHWALRGRHRLPSGCKYANKGWLSLELDPKNWTEEILMNQLKAKIVLLEKGDWIEGLEKGHQGSENTWVLTAEEKESSIQKRLLNKKNLMKKDGWAWKIQRRPWLRWWRRRRD